MSLAEPRFALMIRIFRGPRHPGGWYEGDPTIVKVVWRFSLIRHQETESLKSWKERTAVKRNRHTIWWRGAVNERQSADFFFKTGSRCFPW